MNCLISLTKGCFFLYSTCSHICFTALIPDGLEKKHEPPCLLDLDMFHYLTVLVMSLPTLYAEGQTSVLTTFPTGSLNDQHALQLVLTAHLVQILLTYEPEPQGKYYFFNGLFPRFYFLIYIMSTKNSNQFCVKQSSNLLLLKIMQLK